MKLVIIGCTHAGTAAAVNAAKLYPDADITVYEKNDTVSFLSCGIALYVAGVVKDPKGLFYSSPAKLEQLGIRTCMRHEVTNVDFAGKKLTVKNLDTKKEFEDHYDKLIITTGSWPVIPPIEGIGLGNVLLCKNYEHARVIIKKAAGARNIAVVGAGYIGVELAEAFRRQGKGVTLIDRQERILNKYIDHEITDEAQKELSGLGVQLALGRVVRKLEGKEDQVASVLTDKGTFDADLVVLCIGFKPNTELFKDSLDLFENGAILVNENMKTSAEDVFAAGDCCAVNYNPTNRKTYIPLATNAVRMGTLAAYNLLKPTFRYPGTQGTSGIRIGNYHIASTGITEQMAKKQQTDCRVSLITENNRPEFMPTYEKLLLKVVYEKTTRRMIGAQIISKADLTQSINTLSVCIQNRMTIDELAFTDFFFQPNYNKPWNYLNTAGLNVLGQD